MSLLSISHLSAAYASADVLHDLSIEVGAEEIVTLIGANGAGKSTTLLAISGLVGKTGGRITFSGRDITSLSPHGIVHLGIVHVPEGRGIFPRLTVDENLRMGAFSVGEPEPEITEKIFALFPILRERRRQMGGTLSGGEQQMLAIGRGLMAKPKLLLLDEPSLGIAPILVDRIFAALVEIHRDGTPILLVEQNAHKALAIANRAYVLESGRVTAEELSITGPVSERVLRAYLGTE